MNWIEVTATFAETPADWSLAIDLLDGLGCPNTLLSDGPPSITACLVEVPGSSDHLERIKVGLVELGALDVTTKVIQEEDWMEGFRAHFKPRRVGKRFVVTPTWEGFDSDPSDLVITLDPGQAFGTGDHPTTRMCLELLEQAEVAGSRVADVGCGTGILSIGAVLLGAREVSACDIELLSVEVAKENAAVNNVTFTAITGNGMRALGTGWDVVLSNIISATLISITPDVRASIIPGGRWIVSGVIHDNWPDVLATAQRHGFTLVRHLHDDQWNAALFQLR